MKFILLSTFFAFALLTTLSCEKFSKHEKEFKDISFSSPKVPCLLAENQFNFIVLEQGYYSTDQDGSTTITSITSEIDQDFYNLTIVDSEQSEFKFYFKEKPLPGKYKINYSYSMNFDYDQVNVEFTKNSTSVSDIEYEIKDSNVDKDTLYVNYSSTGDLIINFCTLKLYSEGNYWDPIEYDVSGHIIFTN